MDIIIVDLRSVINKTMAFVPLLSALPASAAIPFMRFIPLFSADTANTAVPVVIRIAGFTAAEASATFPFVLFVTAGSAPATTASVPTVPEKFASQAHMPFLRIRCIFGYSIISALIPFF